MHKIIVYPTLGFQSEQPVPDNAKHAFDALVAAGYTKYLLKN